ncbi:hypothetical protein [Saccharothrix deserti]|uniref:hypothetical protein n=1 Tax=Saccharothrix deserti TaxID=2593674 RepID=UPI00131B5C5D|nr:hypothetical protein [Saccharothrix deserti]
MGQVNQPSNILDQIRDLRRQIAEVRKNSGLSSAILRQGGLSLLEDAFLKMVDDNGVLVLYAGPDAEDRQVFELRREGGAAILTTYFTAFGQAWSLFDPGGQVAVADDADSGQGLARPYIPLPHNQTDWNVMPKTTSASFVTLDEVRYYKQHPRVNMSIKTGAAVGSAGEWRVLQDGAVRASGTITASVITVAFASFAVTGSHLAPLNLDVQARVTSGAGPVSAHIREAGGVQT